MSVIDLFCYNGEKEILDLRLNILNPHVDIFVIGEAELTFSGKAKPLYFEKHMHHFEEFLPKIRYWVVEDYYNPYLLRSMQEQIDMKKTAYPFLMAFYQKQSMMLAIEDAMDTDTVYYGDCDEIWQPKEVSREPYKLRQLVYSHYLNNRSDEPWRGTAIADYFTVKQRGLYQLRLKTELTHENGGWHFTNQGGLAELQRKLQSYDHQEVNVPLVHNALAERHASGSDFLGRGFQNWTDESDWPQYLKQNRHKYAHLCR